MLGLGMIKGTIIGMGVGLLAGLALKEMCKIKKSSSSDNFDKNNEKSMVAPKNWFETQKTSIFSFQRRQNRRSLGRCHRQAYRLQQD